MAFAVLIIAILLIRVGLAHFQREYLLGREIDSINLKWLGRTFRDSFIGEAKTPFEWYKVQVGASLQKIKTPLLLLSISAVFISIASYQVTSALLPAEIVEKIELSDGEIKDNVDFDLIAEAEDIGVIEGLVTIGGHAPGCILGAKRSAKVELYKWDNETEEWVLKKSIDSLPFSH